MRRSSAEGRRFAGSGTGPLASAAPPTRLLVGAFMLGAALLVPTHSASGMLLLGVVVACALLLAGTPSAYLFRILAGGALLYVPLVLVLSLPSLLAIVRESAPEGIAAVFAAPAVERALAMMLKGVAALLVTLSAISTLRPAEIHAAVGGLPLPEGVRLLLIQVLHQAGLLRDESRRVRQALAVRGGGRRTALPRGLATVWLLRVSARAQRVAAAMEVRGYAEQQLPPIHRPGSGEPHDRVMVAIGGLALSTALLLRVLA